MEQEKEILNSGEAAARKDAEMREDEGGERLMSGEKNEIELFAEAMKAENMAFEQTIALVASLRKEKIAEVKEEQKIAAAEKGQPADANQLKKEYDAALQSAEVQFSLAENFKQEAEKRLKILQDLDITSSADIRRLNSLMQEIILVLAEAREQQEKSSALADRAEQSLLAYKKIRLEEAGFNSREEVEEAAEDVYQKQIRASIREIEAKKKAYKGLGSFIKRKEIKQNSAELKRLRDAYKKLDDLAHEIRTVGIPLAELVYNKQKNVSIDINNLSKAGSEAGLKKISYRQTGLIKQIQFSEAEAFPEDPAIMYFAAWQKGAVEGQDEVALDKAPHDKIAWFIKNAAPMAKAREIIKSHNAMQKEVKDAGLDPNHGHFLFDAALRNSAFQQFKQDDDNEAHFIKDINIELWNIYRDNEKAQEFFGQENIETADYFLRSEIIYELLKTEQHTAESINFGEKLLYFPGAATAPVAVLNAYRESGRSGERPFLLIHRKSEESELFKFIMKLDERQLEIIKQKNIPGLYEIITAVKANPTTFNSQSIKNPDITKFTEELKNDEEFLDYVGEQSFPPVEKFEIIRQEAKNKETGEEEWAHHYDPATNEYRIGEKRLKELLPDIQLNYDAMSIKKDDPLFNEIKRALAKDSLKGHEIKPSPYKDKGEFITYLGTNEEYYCCPEEKIVYFLEKQNYPEYLFNNPEVANPLYDEIQQNLVKMSDYYLKSDEPNMKFYLMDLLKKLDADLNGAYDSLSKILTGPPDYRLQKQVFNCLVARIDQYNLGDKKSIDLILENYDAADKLVKAAIRKENFQIISFLLKREPLDSAAIEKTSKIVGIEKGELKGTLRFIGDLKKADCYSALREGNDIYAYRDLYKRGE